MPDTILSVSGSYQIVERAGHKGIKCLKCQRVSFNKNDIKFKYCGHCRTFHNDILPRRDINSVTNNKRRDKMSGLIMVVFAVVFMVLGGLVFGIPAAWISYSLGKEAEAKKHRPAKEWKKTESVSYEPKNQ
jgi:hypothetical protein